jgi:orotidine-5'-phosphate decarboxylase
MTLFNQKYGIIPACDFTKMSDLENLVKSTCEIEGIVGYKIGAILGLKYGLQSVVETISSLTELPIIYDHQKFGRFNNNFPPSRPRNFKNIYIRI